MSAPVVLQIRYSGNLVSALITSSPWDCAMAVYPDYGGVPYRPQFNLDILQIPNLDGARYRVGGAHFPVFRLVTITPVWDYIAGLMIARDMETTRGDKVILQRSGIVNGGIDHECEVISCISKPSAMRVLGANASSVTGPNSPPGDAITSGAGGSIDTLWTLQVLAQ